MSSHMDFQSTGSHELISADFTDVGAFPGVSAFMISEMSLGSKAHVTICEVTLERLLPIVYPHMCE